MGDDYRWYPMGEPEGRGWRLPDTLRPTDRLPARARDLVPAVVWELSRQSASLYHRFRTDAESIAVRWTLPDGPIALPHVSAAGVSGVDLYAEDDRRRLRWAGLGAPTAAGTVTQTLLSGVSPGTPREYRLYLPLLNRADDVAVGVPPGARLEVAAADPAPPVLYYGTSIVHGAAASRAGMALPAMLGRRLGRPVIGMGMNGNARMEQSLAGLLAEPDCAAYVLDCLPNMTPEQVADRTVPFVRRLRRDRPTTPILLVEDRTRADAWIRGDLADGHDRRRAALRSAYRELVAAGEANLHYLDHTGLFGTDGEATVDGSHPTDLGLVRMADILAPAVRALLG